MNDEFFVHEKFMRKMNRRNFIGGSIFGFVAALAFPMVRIAFAASRETVKKCKKKEEHIWHAPESV